MAPPKRDWDTAYLEKKEELTDGLRLELDLIEERIVTDPNRTYQRTYLDDGVIVDASGFDEYGFEVSYLPIGDDPYRPDVFRFVGFTHEDR